MSSETVSLLELVDLSLGTPEIVNYKGLRALLIAIVENLKIGDVRTDLKESDRAELLAAAAAAAAERPVSSDSRRSVQKSKSDLIRIHSGDSSPKEVRDLEQKVSKLEAQIEALNSLPSNEDLIQRARSSTDVMKPMSEMWQLMQLQKKASANEDGVSKLMSMVEDLLGEMAVLREHVDGFGSEINNLKDRLNKISENEDNINEKLLKLENSTANLDRMDELQRIMNDLNNRMNTLPPLDILVTWPAMEDALKGIYKEPTTVSDHAMQTVTSTETSQVQTVPTTSSYSQTRTPSPSLPSRPGSAAHPSAEIQRILRDIGELKGRHDSMEDRVKILEDLMNGKADMEDVKRLLGDKQDVPEDLTKMLAELREGLDSLTEGREKMDQLDRQIQGQSKLVPASQQDIQLLRDELAVIQADLAADIVAMAKNLPVGTSVSASRLDSMHSHLQDQLDGNTQGLAQELGKQLTKVTSRLGHLEQRLNSQGRQLEAQASMGMLVSTHRLHQEQTDNEGSERVSVDLLDSMHSHLQDQLDGNTQGLAQELGKQLTKVTSGLGHLEQRLNSQGRQLEAQASMGMLVSTHRLHQEQTDNEGSERVSVDLDGEMITNMQKLILQLQAEADKLNNTCVHLVDEHNNKQKHIDALYTFVDRLQENKADKEHVIMEIDVKADKRALENKVSTTHFQGTVDEISKNLNDVMDKLTGHRSAWQDAVSEMKLDIDNKLDRMELDPLKTYLDKRIKSVGAKLVRKTETESTIDDAAGFRKALLQKFNCISCDRPLDMTPQPPLASLPESKGLPGMRTGRPYTTFELEQIRAAQKNSRPGRNVMHYEKALQEHELARQRKRDILAYLVHFDRDGDRLAFFRNIPQLQCQLDKQSGNVEPQDYLSTNRSCGGSHTMTYPHRRSTRMTNITNIVREEDLPPSFVNGKIEADIQGQDGHIYKGRIGATDQERLPTIAPQKLPSARSPRPASSCGYRLENQLSKSPPDRHTPRPKSARPQSLSARPQSGRSHRSLPVNQADSRPTTPTDAMLDVSASQDSNNSNVIKESLEQPVEVQ